MPDQGFVANRDTTLKLLGSQAKTFLEHKLARNPFTNVDLDVRLLAEAAFELQPGFFGLLDGHQATGQQISQFESLVNRRANHEPVAYILGQCEFWSLTLKVSNDVLIPRADTETLVERAIACMAEHQVKSPLFADIGTGSGAIAAALLHELPVAKAVATDISKNALNLARENIRNLGFEDRTNFILTSNLDGLAGPFDLIISNPPYIKTEAIEKLIDDVRCHEPHLALDGGPDGLRHFQIIANQAHSALKEGGMILFEIGFDQQKEVEQILSDAGFGNVECITDLAGKSRCISAGKTDH